MGTKKETEPAFNFVTHFEERATKCGNSACNIFSVIIGLLVAAGFIFVFASHFVEWELERSLEEKLANYNATDATLSERQVSNITEQKAVRDKVSSAYKTYLSKAALDGTGLTETIKCLDAYDNHLFKNEVERKHFRIHPESLTHTPALIAALRKQELPVDIHISLKDANQSLCVTTENQREVFISLIKRWSNAAAFNPIQYTNLKDEEAKIQKDLYSLYKDRDIVLEEIARKKALGVDSSNVTVFVQTTTTRFGTIILILFAIGILISIYRYNIQLAVFYHAQADIFRYAEKKNMNVEEMKALSEVLLPKHNFGKSPQTPVQQIVDLAGKNKG